VIKTNETITTTIHYSYKLNSSCNEAKLIAFTLLQDRILQLLQSLIETGIEDGVITLDTPVLH